MTRTPDPRITKSRETDGSNPMAAWVWRARRYSIICPTQPLPSPAEPGAGDVAKLRRLPVGEPRNPTCAIPANSVNERRQYLVCDAFQTSESDPMQTFKRHAQLRWHAVDDDQRVWHPSSNQDSTRPSRRGEAHAFRILLSVGRRPRPRCLQRHATVLPRRGINRSDSPGESGLERRVTQP